MTLAEAWERFKAECITDATEDELKEARFVFMAGALSAVRAISDLKQDDEAGWNAIIDESNDLAKEFEGPVH